MQAKKLQVCCESNILHYLDPYLMNKDFFKRMHMQQVHSVVAMVRAPKMIKRCYIQY